MSSRGTDVRRGNHETIGGTCRSARGAARLWAWMAAVVAALIVAAPAQARRAGLPLRRAELTVTPAAATAGSSLTLSGGGLPAHRVVWLSLGGRRKSVVRTDGRGRWATRVRVARRAGGHVMLRVTFDSRALFLARLAVQARAAGQSSSLALLAAGEHATLSPIRVAAGAVVRVAGGGFAGRGLVGVWLGSRRLARLRPDGGGAVRASVRIPAATRARPYVLSLHAGETLTFNMTVTPHSGAGPGSSGSPPAAPPPPAGSGSPPVLPSETVVDAVGDMACDPSDPNYNNGNGQPAATYPANNCLGRYVSDLIVGDMPDALLELGDNQQDPGQSAQTYQAAFDPTFGRANAVAFPIVGNAEYGNEFNGGNAVPPSAFFNYFQGAGVFSRIAAMPGSDTSHLTENEMYYSFNLGTWHIIALNSNCSDNSNPANVGNCGTGGPEETWLRQDLATYRQTDPNGCILAYWHHPLFGTEATDPASQAWWQDLYAAHATLVLNGHGGNSYQRYAPQDPSGNATPDGIRELIVSTGGLSHTNAPAGTPPSTLQVANYDTFGILQLTLHPDSYDWRFIPATDDGQPSTFTDAGSAACAG